MFEFEELQQRVDSYSEPLADLRLSLHLDHARERISELEAIAAEPDFWTDADKATKQQQELKQLQDKLSEYTAITNMIDDLTVMIELGNEAEDREVISEIERDLQKLQVLYDDLRLRTLFIGEHDAADAIISLHAGAGGTEAQDWVSMLFRMYQRWAESHAFKCSIIDYLDGEDAGIKNVSLKIEGANAYGYLRSEHGVHRLVRISPFDASGRRHTSFASAEVMPVLDQSIEVNINPDDLRIDYYRSSGAGGQHVNKTSSAVRITHLPTGVVCACQNERSQTHNRETAMEMLKAKLYTLAKQAHMEKIEDLKGEQLDIGWGSQIRSYIFCPYTKVKDHRSEYETADVNGVMDGDLDPFITAYLSMKE